MRFMVWDVDDVNNEPKWDPADLPVPDQNVDAEDPVKAAETYAVRNRRADVSLIVFTESIGYTHVELVRSWQVETHKPMTLSDLRRRYLCRATVGDGT